MPKGIRRNKAILQAIKSVDFMATAVKTLKRQLKRFETGNEDSVIELRDALDEYAKSLRFFQPYCEELDNYLEEQDG